MCRPPEYMFAPLIVKLPYHLVELHFLPHVELNAAAIKGKSVPMVTGTERLENVNKAALV